jgi:hypothetical protein
VNWRETSERHEAVLRQLNEERAVALTRISRTLDALIEQLHAIGIRIEREPDNVSPADADHHGFLGRFYAVPGPLRNS